MKRWTWYYLFLWNCCVQSSRCVATNCSLNWRIKYENFQNVHVHGNAQSHTEKNQIFSCFENVEIKTEIFFCSLSHANCIYTQNHFEWIWRELKNEIEDLELLICGFISLFSDSEVCQITQTPLLFNSFKNSHPIACLLMFFFLFYLKNSTVLIWK